MLGALIIFVAAGGRSEGTLLVPRPGVVDVHCVVILVGSLVLIAGLVLDGDVGHVANVVAVRTLVDVTNNVAGFLHAGVIAASRAVRTVVRLPVGVGVGGTRVPVRPALGLPRVVVLDMLSGLGLGLVLEANGSSVAGVIASRALVDVIALPPRPAGVAMALPRFGVVILDGLVSLKLGFVLDTNVGNIASVVAGRTFIDIIALPPRPARVAVALPRFRVVILDVLSGLRLGLILDTDGGSISSVVAGRALVDIIALPAGRRGSPVWVSVPGARALPRLGVVILDVLVGSVGSTVLDANVGGVAGVVAMGALVDTTLGVRSGRQHGKRNAASQALHFL